MSSSALIICSTVSTEEYDVQHSPGRQDPFHSGPPKVEITQSQHDELAHCGVVNRGYANGLSEWEIEWQSDLTNLVYVIEHSLILNQIGLFCLDARPVKPKKPLIGYLTLGRHGSGVESSAGNHKVAGMPVQTRAPPELVSLCP